MEKHRFELAVCQLQYDTNLTVADAQTARALHEAVGGRAGPFPRVEKHQSGWRFLADDGAWVVTVLPDHVALESSAFRAWDEFRARLQALFATVGEQLAPATEHRLGLRYIHRLAANTVAPGVLGPLLHPRFGPAVRAAQQQLLLEFEETRCGFRHGLDGDGAYVLDYDVYREGPRPFGVSDCVSAVEAFHGHASQLFEASLAADRSPAARR